MSGSRPIGVGVIGAGFIGATHLRAFAGTPGCRIAAVCDADPARLSGRPGAAGNLGDDDSDALFDPDDTWTGADPDALIRHSDVDLVCVCTPTDTHVDLAVKALDAGKHVLVEKPVAITSSRVRALRDHAASSDRACVPAMCVRFWPGWDDLPSVIRSGEHGPLRSLRFTRVGAAPAWSSFYADTSRSGDALFDLHVHDVDMVHRCVGPPTAVRASGSTRHVTSVYQFGTPVGAVSAEGGWIDDPGASFRMRFEAEFERARLVFDLGAASPLSLVRGDHTSPVEIQSGTGWDAQARAVVEAIRTESFDALPSLDEALAVTRTIEAERRSLDAGGESARIPLE